MYIKNKEFIFQLTDLQRFKSNNLQLGRAWGDECSCTSKASRIRVATVHPFDPVVPLQGIYLRKRMGQMGRNVLIGVFIAVLFLIAKIRIIQMFIQ